ncbi:hypothetical protein HBDW_13440 [Herbaspirillum sp. DW155]|uniref:hypothetical protein n=1 Tax=Herbaspirillum sp. DW155 TaxID=3095609 RepID=UPI00308FF3ED|nr:hypothetical protein HBDW_13440 [Herbaspirillum sp. DW155]
MLDDELEFPVAAQPRQAAGNAEQAAILHQGDVSVCKRRLLPYVNVLAIKGALIQIKRAKKDRESPVLDFY